MKMLLQAKANPNTVDTSVRASAGLKMYFRLHQTYTPLHLAAEGGHVDVMALLVSAGASIHAKTKYVRAEWLMSSQLTQLRLTHLSITLLRPAKFKP